MPGYGPGMMENMGGFDPRDLMAAPAIRQEQTRNQADMVSAPYEQANRMAADKTNPMNAESQEPGKIFLDYYLQGPNFSTFKDPGIPLLIPKRK